MWFEMIDKAVETRFNQIKAGLSRKVGDYIYSGRTNPTQLGWRFRQNYESECGKHLFSRRCAKDIDTNDILNGVYDDLIEYTWHDAASAQYWYTYEKCYF